MPLCLLDTDTLSEVLKQKNAAVIARAAAYLQVNQQFTFSAMTRYEILRGLRAKNATRQLQQFAVFCQHSSILPLTDAIFDRATDLWVTTHAAGRPKMDADLLIAATALEHGLNLATGNTIDFSWIAGLVVEDWRQPQIKANTRPTLTRSAGAIIDRGLLHHCTTRAPKAIHATNAIHATKSGRQS